MPDFEWQTTEADGRQQRMRETQQLLQQRVNNLINHSKKRRMRDTSTSSFLFFRYFEECDHPGYQRQLPYLAERLLTLLGM